MNELHFGVADIRGNAWEHDPGPSRSSGWPALFAETPNYRGLAAAVVGREAFRWQHGPMFFRGRLNGSASVLVVGQEGAQDESLSHRSFTGSTGARMQHLLRHLGLDRSYLFLNSFIYPIFGQYTLDLRPIAQDPRSPIVSHRHRVLDKAVVDGDVRLVIAVGLAAKESITTWITAHGGTALPAQLESATLGSLPARLRVVGVLHPGSSSGSTKEIAADFTRAIGLIKGWLDADPAWLPADAGMTRDLTTPYVYAADPVPFRDFPFGVCPRLGVGGTSSNRSNDQRSIRLFSVAGRYNATGVNLSDPFTPDGSSEGYDDDPGDLPYEAPRIHPYAFDPGPSADLARLLLGGEPGFEWPDFRSFGVTSDASFGVGPIYRGRFRRLSLIVLADQTSNDDVFTGRALSGEAGQSFQGFLRAAGLTTRYLILRTLPVDCLDLGTTQLLALVDDPKVQALHRELLARLRSANPESCALLAIGPGARQLAPKIVPAGLPVIGLAGFGEPGWAEAWQVALDDLAGRTYPRDLSKPTFAMPAQRSQLPRRDLPYGTTRWVGTSGDRAVRPTDLDLGRPSPDYVELFVPAWVANLGPAPLSAAEQAAADQLPR